MSNSVLFGKNARAKLKEGIDLVHGAVSVTLGANGRNVVFNKWSRIPIITNDGVSIAREIAPEDLGALQGANLLKQVSERTNDEAGDGTTTSIVLAHSMIEQGMKLLDSDEKVNPMQLRREMKDATEKVIEALKASAVECKTLEALEQVATISVEDPAIGKTIAKAIFESGDNGIVYVNESTDVGVSIEKIEGYQFPQGMITPYLIHDVARMETVIENAAVFITDIQLELNDAFINLVQKIVNQNCKNILVICDEIHPKVIEFAVLNMAKSNFTMLLVKKPMQKEYLEDIAAVVGATAMTSVKGKTTPSIEYVGRCKKAIVTMNDTTIFVDDTKVKTLNEYVATLTAQLDTVADDVIAKGKIEERIAKLTSGVYMLNVGDKTEAESKYLKLKVDDAVNATKAAKEEGIVAGGGMALWDISDALEAAMTNGERIIYDACRAPLSQIVDNSGMELDEVVNSMTRKGMGFNALTLKIETDMIAAGITDPVKVTRCAFENASSFAGLLLTTESLITPNPEAPTGLEK